MKYLGRDAFPSQDFSLPIFFFLRNCKKVFFKDIHDTAFKFFFGVFAILVRFRATSSISDILCLTFVVRSLREKGRNSEPSS